MKKSIIFFIAIILFFVDAFLVYSPATCNCQWDNLAGGCFAECAPGYTNIYNNDCGLGDAKFGDCQPSFGATCECSAPNEICDVPGDDDNDGLGDCADPECFTGSYFEVQRNDRAELMRIYQSGVVELAGDLITGWTGSPSVSSNDFIIEDSSGNVKAWLDAATGNLYLSGSAFQYTGGSPSTSGNLVIKDENGNNAAWFTSAGNFRFQSCIKYLNCDSDGDGYFKTSCGGSDCDDNEYHIYPSSTWSNRGTDPNIDVDCDGGTTRVWTDILGIWVNSHSSEFISRTDCNDRGDPGTCLSSYYQPDVVPPGTCNTGITVVECEWAGSCVRKAGSLILHSRCW